MTTTQGERGQSVVFHSFVSVGLAWAAIACGGSSGPVTYCDVQPILENRCVRCHGEPPQHGAPFVLNSYEATQETFVDAPMYEWMANAVSTDFMPPVTLDATPPVEDLTSVEVDTIVTWADAGAPAGGCE
jgi:uncharacterized membrane protein